MYHECSRRLHEEDLHGYICCISKFTNMFFALNHPNYARWTVKYHNSLLTLEEMLSETLREHQDGMFSIHRTKKPFSGNPIDWTLEQTINTNAASQRMVLIPWLRTFHDYESDDGGNSFKQVRRRTMGILKTLRRERTFPTQNQFIVSREKGETSKSKRNIKCS